MYLQETRHHSSKNSAIADRNISSPSKPAALEVRHPIPVVPDAVDPLDSPPIGNAVSDSEGKLSPHLAVMRKETFERPLTRAPPQRQHSTTARPKSSRRPPSRTGRERLTLVRPESRCGKFTRFSLSKFNYFVFTELAVDHQCRTSSSTVIRFPQMTKMRKIKSSKLQF